MNQFGERGEPFVFYTDFLGSQAWIQPVSNPQKDGVKIQIGPDLIYGQHPESPKKTTLSFAKTPLSFSDFKITFDQVVEQVNLGNSYLVNLTFQTPITCNYSISDLFNQTQALYKLQVDEDFVVFSPETFIKIQDGWIYSFPMKGTINARIPNAREVILNDKKETAEHITIVDLIRNDLSQVASEVKVKRFRYITEINTHDQRLYQVSSEIMGRLEDDYHRQLGTLLFQLLPAGSISGAPKQKTIEIIRAVENYSRGFYTGICGYFDGKNLDSGVMIRYIEKIDGQLYFKSGGGITSFSTAETEYQEIIDKIYVPIY